MDVLKLLPFLLLVTLNTGCQMGYYLKSANSQFSLMRKREPIEDVLKNPDLTADTRQKLETAQAAREFAIHSIGLKETKNYTSYVQLDRPYVTYVVSAAPRWTLEHYEWNYLFVGKMPYKGFANEDDAKEEQQDLIKQDMDTYVRGVSAYSTLGWFQDSVLSSMMKSKAHDLVNTIIHETTHATLYIHNSADFNERLAVFVGNKGTEQFYIQREGAISATLKEIRNENADDETFSAFIGPQLKALEEWYKALPPEQRHEEERQARFHAIQDNFVKDVLPRMKTKNYERFSKAELNNARLLYFKMYMQDLKDFETLFASAHSDWPVFLRCAKTLEKAEKPQDSLKSLNESLAMAGADIEKICPK